MGLLLERDSAALSVAIEESCANKAEIVKQDEREAGIRATLNLGHTFGHAIETGSGYGQYWHGEAVAIGICQAADLSERIGWLDAIKKQRIIAAIDQAGLPIRPPKSMDRNCFLELMAVDKKNIDGKIRLILLKEIGQASLPHAIDPRFLAATLDEYGQAAR